MAAKFFLDLGDSSVVIRWIKSKKGDGSYLEGMVRDIDLWAESIKDFACSYIMWEGSLAANDIADMGSNGSTVQFTKFSLHEELMTILYEERIVWSCMRKGYWPLYL